MSASREQFKLGPLRRRKTASSPTCELSILAAYTRSRRIAKVPQFLALLCGGQTSHSFSLQQGLALEFTGRGPSVDLLLSRECQRYRRNGHLVGSLSCLSPELRNLSVGVTSADRCFHVFQSKSVRYNSVVRAPISSSCTFERHGLIIRCGIG